MWRRILEWFGAKNQSRQRCEPIDLIDPGYRMLFGKELRRLDLCTKRAIRFRLNRDGYSILVGRRRVHRIAKADIEADWEAKDYVSLDGRVIQAAEAVVRACGI